MVKGDKNILDKGFETNIRDFMRTDEEIIWEGTPLSEKRYQTIERGWKHSSLPDRANLTGLLLGVIILAGYYCYTEKYWLLLTVTMLLGACIMVLPDMLLHMSRKHTHYVLTNQRVCFQLWKYGQKSHYFIPLNDIVEVRYELFDDQSGNLFFFTRTYPDFETIDFFTGNKRFQPSFEHIVDVMKVYNHLQSNLSRY